MTGRERTPLLYKMIHTVLPPILTAIYRPWIEGAEHIPTEGPAILASNHLSFLDHFFLPRNVVRTAVPAAPSERAPSTAAAPSALHGSGRASELGCRSATTRRTRGVSWRT